MKVLLDGPVTDDTMETAELLGIVPTSVVHTGLWPLPILFVPARVVWNPMEQTRWGEWPARRINHYRITLGVEAAVVKGENEHLLHLLDLLQVLVYAEK